MTDDATTAPNEGRPRGRPRGSLNRARIARAKLQVILPAVLVERLEEKAAEEGVPKSYLVKEALEAYLK